MKKEKKQVSKLEKTAKVDSKKVIITDEMAENYMRDKIKKKRGRPKKVSEDINRLNFNPQLADLKRLTKTMKKATLEDVQGFVGKQIEMSYPIIEQVIGKEYFSELMKNPKAKEILSSENVKTLIAEMVKEYTDFTMDVLSEISDAKFSVSDLNKNSEALDRVNQLKEKYNPKLVSEIELYKASINPKKEFNRIVTEYLTDEDFRKLSEEALDKINEVDCSEMKTTSRWRPEFLAQVKPIEINNNDLREEEKEFLPKSELKEAPINSMKEPQLDWIEIKLKNATDEKLKDVLVFDHHEEFKGRVEYSSSVFDLGIKEFLRQLSSIQKGKYAIRFFRYIASCDLQKFADKQTNAYITAKYSDLLGKTYSIPYRPDHLKDHDNRVYKSIADVTTDRDLSFYSNLSLSLEYLMPETTLTIYIVVEKLNNIK
jgi:hypothetical protein